LLQIFFALINIVTHEGFAWLVIMGSRLGLLALLYNYNQFITAHNQLLSKTRSIPYWTTSVFSSAWLTWFWFTSRVESSRVLCYDRRYLGIKYPSWAYDQIFITVRQLRVCWWGRSLWREDGSFVCNYYCWPTHSYFRVRVLWDSRPYFTVSDSRLSFVSPPTTRRATVEVFDPASTRHSDLRMNYDSFITSWSSVYRSPPRTVRVIVFLRRHEMCLPNRCSALGYYSLSRKRVFGSRWIAMDYSGFQASCYNI
jgi:hypothetical protein